MAYTYRNIATAAGETVSFDTPQPRLVASAHWQLISDTYDAAAIAAVDKLNAGRTAAAHVADLVEDAGNTGEVTGGGSTVGTFTRLTPEDYGAKRDGKVVTDAAIAESATTLTSATAAFTADDVGKYIAVSGAGLTANGGTLVATIDSVTDASTVVLSTAAAAAVTGARAAYGTDDTEAIQAAIDAAVAAGIADTTYYAEVVFSPGQYVVAAAPQMGAPYYGFAQIRIPVMPETGKKFTLALTGGIDGSPFVHWNQTVPQTGGAVIRSMMIGVNDDGLWGVPACIGGPTRADQGGGFSAGWSNMLLHVDGLTVLAPRDPCFVGLDTSRIAQLTIGSYSALADRTATEMHNGKPLNDQGLGLAVPRVSNNDNVVIRSYSCEGWYYGMTLTDHLTATRVAIIYCRVAMGIYGVGGASEHGANITNASVEDCDTVVEASVTPGGRFPLRIAQVNTELAAGTAFIDAGGGLVGDVWYTANDASAPTVSGCANWQIFDLNRRPGAVTAPSVPASTVGLKNPFWRNAAVHIAGGTVTGIAVDGTTLGVTSGLVMVPTGKTITLTHSSAPTWVWTLL